MDILLTGSGGYVGKNLKEFLQEEYNLFTPRSFELDLSNEIAVGEYFKAHDIDFVIHCGTVGGVRGVADAENTEVKNLQMVENILKYKKPSVRVILFGSGAMYGKTRNLHKVSETEIGEFIPKDLYGKSKLEISKITEARDDVLCLNIFGCYGKYEKETRFPTYAITQNLKNETIRINQNVVFDYLYIDDLCKIVKYFIENVPRNKVINVTPNESISLTEIADIVNEVGDNKVEVEVVNPVLNNEYSGSNVLLKSEIEGIEFTSYREGLRELYNFIKKVM